MLQPFAKIIPLINLHLIPHYDKANTGFIKKEKLKYDIEISIQTLCYDT